MYQIVALQYVQFDIPKSVGSYYRFTIIPNARGKNKREFAFNPKPCTKQERRQSASFLCFISTFTGGCVSGIIQNSLIIRTGGQPFGKLKRWEMLRLFAGLRKLMIFY